MCWCQPGLSPWLRGQARHSSFYGYGLKVRTMGNGAQPAVTTLEGAVLRCGRLDILCRQSPIPIAGGGHRPSDERRQRDAK